MDAPYLRNRAGEVSQPIEGVGDVIAGDVDFPIVTGPFQKSYGFATFLDAFLIARGDIKDDSIKMKRLSLPPQVAQRFVNGQRFLGIGNSPTEIGNQAHDWSM